MFYMIGGVPMYVLSSRGGGGGGVNDNEEEEEEEVDVVFVIHEREGSRKSVQGLCERIIAKRQAEGVDHIPVMTVSFDVANHGERLIDPLRNKAWGEGNYEHSADMMSQMIDTLNLISLSIDILPMKLRKRFHRIAITGVSQGGHTSLLVMANEPRIDVCCAFISSGDYIRVMNERYEQFRSRTQNCPSFESLFPSDFRSFCEKYNPANRIYSFQLRPLCMVNGGADSLVSVGCNIDLEKRLRPIYESKKYGDRLKLYIHPEVKHKVTPQMYEQGVEFLMKWLTPIEKVVVDESAKL